MKLHTIYEMSKAQDWSGIIRSYAKLCKLNFILKVTKTIQQTKVQFNTLTAREMC